MAVPEHATCNQGRQCLYVNVQNPHVKKGQVAVCLVDLLVRLNLLVVQRMNSKDLTR